jgi:hypothetical protein
LSPAPPHRTSGIVPELFDMHLRALRRDRSLRGGAELFLFERAFDDCLERIGLMNRRFERALLDGWADPDWGDRLRSVAATVEQQDFRLVEDAWEPPAQTYDLVLSIGTLDTVNDLALALRLIHYAMAPDALFIGALSGGETLPQLRAAMRAADAVSGVAAPRVHPRIEPSALSPLLADAGFVRPVVDVDRVEVSYASLQRLVTDLRAMGATNILTGRGPPLGRPARDAAARAFTDAGQSGRTTETFELLHFAAWTPARG